jgi:glycosyltransferase involved in cell wall biosynthesis
MKIYIIGVPHTQATTAFSTCAYTIKSRNLCKMMMAQGHHVVFLGVEGSDPVCSENVSVISEAERCAIYGPPSNKFYDIGMEGEKGVYLRKFSKNVEREIFNRASEPWSEIICCPWGTGHYDCIKEMIDKQFVVESGIGYPCTFSKYRVFESYAWMHFIWGRESRADGNGWQECVIPNAFDVDQFTLIDRSGKADHFLFMGRLIEDKGVRLAIDVAKRLGRKIIIIGQGDPRPFLDGNPHVEYKPAVGPAERNVEMGRAAAFFCPTYYVEPFGGVAVEAQLCGTPVICTDWGVFPETVLHGITGYRCKTFDHFLWAARNIEKIEPATCRRWAESNFSLEKIAVMYAEYFQLLLDYRTEGFYAVHQRNDLNFLRKNYP